MKSTVKVGIYFKIPKLAYPPVSCYPLSEKVNYSDICIIAYLYNKFDYIC